MVSKKRIFVIIIFILLNRYLILFGSETDVNSENIFYIEEYDDFEPSDLADEDDYYLEIEEYEVPQTSRQQRTYNFSLNDVLNFITQDKANMRYYENLYEAPFHDIFKINNIWLINTQLPIDSYIWKIKNFGLIEENKFTKEKYPYTVTLTRLHAGLGDFDKNIAHLSMFKDEFITVENLNFRGDFRGRDEEIQRFNHRASELFLQLEYKLELGTRRSTNRNMTNINENALYNIDFDVDVENYVYNDLASDVEYVDDEENEAIYEDDFLESAIEFSDNLSTDYYQIDAQPDTFNGENNIGFSTTYLNSNRNLLAQKYYFNDIFTLNNEMLSDNWQFMSFEIDWKYFFINTFHSSNKIESDRSDNLISFETLGMGLGSQFDWKNNDVNISYQRTFKRVIEPVYESNYDNIFALNHILNNRWIKIDTDFVLFDNFSKLDTRQNMIINFHPNISLLSNLRYSDVKRSNLTYRFENHERLDLRGGFRFDIFNQNAQTVNLYMQADFLFGQKKITQYTPLFNLNEEFFTLSSDIKASVSIKDFVFFLDNCYVYDNFSEDFYLLPSYTNTLDLSLSWLMKHNNQMSIGSRITFLGDLINDTGSLIKSNPVVDAYFSIGISKLFDIKLEINNIYRNWYFGNNLLNDFNISSYLIWYFIN